MGIVIKELSAPQQFVVPNINILNTWDHGPLSLTPQGFSSGLPAEVAVKAPEKPKPEFQSHCKGCAGPLDPHKDNCNYCGVYFREPSPPPIPIQELILPEVPTFKITKPKRKWWEILIIILCGMVSSILYTYLFQKRR